MSRLLFAAARGARIRWRRANEEPESLSVVREMPKHYRIHPDDEHLQYGPVSTALRQFAKRSNENYIELGPTVTYIDWSVDTREDVGQADALHYSLFTLFMAEALADEGL